jgi:hypothetical protein
MYKICIYHSKKWDELVSQGYITAFVNGNLAYMLYDSDTASKRNRV